MPRLFATLVALLTCASAAGAELRVHVTDRRGVPLANAVVYAAGPAAQTAPPGTTATIDQVAQQFAPRVTVVQTGTLIEFPNSDRIRHSVYSFSPPRTFTLKLYAGRPANPVLFDQPGVVVLGCNIHDRMAAWVRVVDTPHFAITDATGVARLSLPAGPWRLSVWHPSLAAERAPLDLALATDTLRDERVQLDAEPVESLLP